MGKNYTSVEKEYDKQLRYKRKKEEKEEGIAILEETIRSLIEDQQIGGLTDEQMFLIKYYGLDEEKIKNKEFGIFNVEQAIDIKNELSEEKIENDRYDALIDMYSVIEEFNRTEINSYNDRFHKEIKSWNDYTRDFEKDTLMVKKMRVLQMLNKMAHKYGNLFRSILYKKNSRLGMRTEKDKKRIENIIEEMFSKVDDDAKKAEKKLIEEFGEESVKEWKNNRAIEYCIKVRRWMFKQKDQYLFEILQHLQNNNEGYNYGVLGDGFIFDVPEYGQFGVHLGENNTLRVEEARQAYKVSDYNGKYLKRVYILSKADPELLKNVNYEELSEEEKQIYKILYKETKEEQIEEINLDDLIEGAKNKEKALEIISILEQAGLDPKEVVTKTLLDKGQPDAIRDVIEIIGQNEYGIGLDILTRCKTLLSVSQNKAIDIMEMLDKINKLGIDSNIITENPNFLTVSKSDKLEPIYEVLKQYKIDLSNHNISVAFEGAPQNIKKNMDLVIENGLYDLAKIGVIKFFTSNNSQLNMRINLLRQHNNPLVVEKKDKRKINGTIFKTEKDLMELYGIDKKEILDELSKIKGQDLIRDNRYYMEEENEEIVLDEIQQEISNSIYEKLNRNHLEKDLVIKIGNYFYSAIKVKEQIDSIIANLDIHDLESENVNEILKIALFKNKNINQEEIDEVSKQIDGLTIEGTIEEINKEEIDEETEYQIGEEEIDEVPQQIDGLTIEGTIEEINKEEIAEETEHQIGKKEEIDEVSQQIEELIIEESIQEGTQQQEDEQVSLNEDNSKYEEIRRITSDILEKEQKIEKLEQIIEDFKETRRTLKQTIQEMEEKINNSILDNDEPSDEIMQDIKELRIIVEEQRKQRKKVKQMIKDYKENKKMLKYALKQEKKVRDSEVDDLVL